VSFKNYFSPGMSLIIKASVEEWVSQKDNRKGLDMKIKNINMLSEVKKELVKSVKITIPSDSVTDELIEQMSPFIVKHEKGMTAKHLRFQIVDNETKMKIDLFSRNNYIELSESLVSFLEEMEEVEYSLG
jgi:DNA polymerase III subunit alpha